MKRLLFPLVASCALGAQAAPFTIGQTTVFTTGDCCNANLLLAQHTPVPQDCRLQSISFYASVGSGQLVLAVYSDSGGKPGALIAKTGTFNAVTGWNTQPVIGQIPAGAAWLTYLPSSSALQFPKRSIGLGAVFYSRTFASGMPTTFGTAYSTTPSQWAFYATCDSVPVAKPNAPGAPSLVIAKYGLMQFAWDYADPVSEFRLYTGVDSSGCPGPRYTAVPASPGTVAHLLWGSTQTAQVTAVAGGQESECSNVVTGQPR